MKSFSWQYCLKASLMNVLRSSNNPVQKWCDRKSFLSYSFWFYIRASHHRNMERSLQSSDEGLIASCMNKAWGRSNGAEAGNRVLKKTEKLCNYWVQGNCSFEGICIKECYPFFVRRSRMRKRLTKLLDLLISGGYHVITSYQMVPIAYFEYQVRVLWKWNIEELGSSLRWFCSLPALAN